MMFLSSFKQVVNKLRLRGLYRANCHTLIRTSTTLSCSEDRYGGVHIQLNQPFETKAFSYSLKGTHSSRICRCFWQKLQILQIIKQTHRKHHSAVGDIAGSFRYCVIIAFQRKLASPVEIHAGFLLFTSQCPQAVHVKFFNNNRNDATFNFPCVHVSINNLEFCPRSMCHFKDCYDYQNGLADIFCKPHEVTLC